MSKRIILNTNFLRTISLVLFLFISLLFSSHHVNAQSTSAKRYKGQYGAKKKLFGNNKPKYKYIKKRKKRKKLKKRSNQASARRKLLNRRRKKAWNGKSKSLYSSSKNRRKRKGSYPKSKRDLASKASAMVFTGVVITTSGEPINQNGEVENVFANYHPGPTFGVGMSYNHTDQISIVGKASAYPLRQENFKMNAMTLGLDVKYNFVSTRKSVSPYFSAGVTYSFAAITKKGFDFVEEKDSSYSVLGSDGRPDPNLILIVEEVSRDPAISTNVVPMFGYKLAVGVDFKINRKFSGFFQLDYDYSFAKSNNQLKSFFPSNAADFKFISINGGIRIDLFKSKSLY